MQSIINDLTRTKVNFTYDQWDSLVSGTYSSTEVLKMIYKNPDAVGNIYESKYQKDRVYDTGGKLL
ncbi:hypothetical protein, partial [Myroides sp. C20-1]